MKQFIILLIATCLLNVITTTIKCDYTLSHFLSSVTIKDSCYVDIVETFTMETNYPYPSQLSRYIPLYNGFNTSNNALKKNVILPKSVKLSTSYDKLEINYHDTFIELVIKFKDPLTNSPMLTLSYQTNVFLFINDKRDTIVYDLNVGPIEINAAAIKFTFSDSFKDFNGYLQFYDYTNFGKVEFYEKAINWVTYENTNPTLKVSFPPLKELEKCVHEPISEFTTLVSINIVNLIGLILIFMIQFIVIIYLIIEKRKKKYAFLADSNNSKYGSDLH